MTSNDSTSLNSKNNNILTQESEPQDSVTIPKIGIIGVGGAGGNAVHNMLVNKLEGCQLIIANTDAQALHHNQVSTKIQLGEQTTQGLGAGSRPDIGKLAAEECIAKIEETLEGLHMLFLTAGMGGGTGTGASPVIAKIAKDKGILTIGFVTTPFDFEGKRRKSIAEKGIEELLKTVDTLVVIPNQNLFRISNENTSFHDAFVLADHVLYGGIRSVVDLMLKPGMINLDFSDIRSIMQDTGRAMMGTGEAEGENRAIEAAELSIQNPLLDDNNIESAKNILISITGSKDLKIYEVDEAANCIRSKVDPNSNIIFGCFFDDQLENKIRISVIAAGIDSPSSIGSSQNPLIQGIETQKTSNQDSQNTRSSSSLSSNQDQQKKITPSQESNKESNKNPSIYEAMDITQITSTWLDKDQLPVQENDAIPSTPSINEKTLVEQMVSFTENTFMNPSPSSSQDENSSVKIETSSINKVVQSTPPTQSSAKRIHIEETFSVPNEAVQQNPLSSAQESVSVQKNQATVKPSSTPHQKDIFDVIKDFEDDLFEEEDSQLSIPAFLRKKEKK